MKNNTLKKIGAIALAAVMAVTFAPVASLDVFADEVKLDKDGKTITAIGDISKAGTYILQVEEYDKQTPNELKIKGASGKVLIDLNGQNTNITMDATAKDAYVEIKDSKTALAEKGVLKIVDAQNAKHVKIDEGVTTGENNPTGWIGGDKVPALNGTAAAKVGTTNYYVGNDLINAAAKVSDGAKEPTYTYANVAAVSGSVVVKKLGDGKTATIDGAALPKTTISATAEDKVSMINVKTTYNFLYKGTKDSEAKDVTGKYTYTDNAYYAGSSFLGNESGKLGNANELTAAAVPNQAKTEAGVKVGADNSTVSSKAFKYERVISLRQNSQDAFDTKLTAVGYADTHDYDASNDGTSSGITYFAANPVKYINPATYGVALIDGKYVVYGSATANLSSYGKLAQSSVEIVQARGYDKDNGNETVTDSFETGKTTVTVKAPADITVVSKIEDNGSNTETSDTKTVYIYGKNATETGKDYKDDFTATYAKTFSVDQIMKGKTFTVTGVTDDARDGKVVTKASGIGYYYEDGYASNDNDYTFGVTADITKDYVTKAVGEKSEDYTTNASWTSDETVFASKEIVADLKGVADTVTLKGEASAEETGKDEEKHTKDWAINKNQKSETAKMYRFNNTITGEHFYTSDAKEVATLQGAEGKAAGWVDETADKNTYKVLPAESETGVAVYRLFNSIANEHFFTTDKAEANAAVAANVGWKLEGTNGVAFKAAPADTTEEKVTVYRMHRPSDDAHLFTPDSAEVDWLVGLGQGWEKEGTDGIAFYGFK